MHLAHRLEQGVEVSVAAVDAALKLEGIDHLGLDELDRQFLRVIIDIYRGGPVGKEAIAATLGEETDTLVDMVEPFLLQIGFLARTRSGRVATKRAYDHLGLTYDRREDPSLFEPGDEAEEA